MRKSILTLFAFAATCVFAQNGIENDNRYGVTPEDSIRCVRAISNYTINIKNKSYDIAYPYWKDVFTNFPVASVNTYAYGSTLLKGMITKETDEQKKLDYINELISVYDQQIKYLDKLQALTKTQLSEGNILGKKVMDYIKFVPNASEDSIYKMLSKSTAIEKGLSEYYVTQELMRYSTKMYKKNPEAHGEQIIEDYLNASTYIVEVLDKYYANVERYEQKYKEFGNPKDSINAEMSSKQIAAARVARNNIDAFFINSGAASCEDLNRIYSESIETHKADIQYLNKVISVMSMLKCTEQDAYLAASEYALAIEPTAKAATGCGYRYYKRGDIEKAMEFFNQAIELEASVTNKAELCNVVAQLHLTSKQYSKARSYAQKAISMNSKFGDPYIVIAQCYAAAPNWSDDNVKNSCTFFAAIDKLQRAKAVDPSVGKEANKLISSYSACTPAKEELFMRGLTSGTKITIGGWINETTTIR